MEMKERILVKSGELFTRYGIRSVSMDNIASELGASKKTLYQYFADKDELVNAVFDLDLNMHRGLCMQCHQQGENAIHEVFLSYDMIDEMLSSTNPVVLFDLEKYHPSAFKKYVEFKSSFMYNIIKDNLERGISEELYRPEIDVDVLARFRAYTLLLSFNQQVFPSNKTNRLYVEHQLIENFLYGVATPKGVKLIQKYKSQRTKNYTK